MYDLKDNLLSEKDELGKMTFYVYDVNSINITKMAQPLNGTDTYTTSAPQGNFAITSYTYYTTAESQSQTGKTIVGLLKTVTDPEGGVTTYTYDSYGYIATVKDALNKVTTSQHNKLGWLKSSTSPKGYTTSYYYDKKGNVLKTVAPDGGVTRNVYNFRNQVTQTIMPKQYLASADTTAAFNAENIQSSSATTYSQSGHGWRYAYGANGTLTSETDPLGNVTNYTYDVYGNRLTETMPNGAVYTYTYDVMNRVTGSAFKETASSAAVNLTAMGYAILTNGQTTVTETKYLNSSEESVTKTTYDYSGRVVRTDLPDGSVVTRTYNSNGTLATSTDGRGNTAYYAYDGLNRQTGQWTPVGTSTYAYNGMTYDKAGRVKTRVQSKDLVSNSTIPTSNLVTTTYMYNANGKVTEESVNSGAKTTYTYDDNGNITEKRFYTNSSSYTRETYTYNSMNRQATKSVYAQYMDISGYSATGTTSLALTTTYTYDLNGNPLTIKDANNITTTYTYDLMDRQLSVSQPGLNENGATVTITTSQTYDWAGNVLTATDELARVSTYIYDKRGFLTQIKNALNGIQYYTYDLAGRKTAEVSSSNYSTGAIHTLPRTEYTYDLMGRILTEKEYYRDEGATQKSFVNKKYTYDDNGNVTKLQDALGVAGNYGTNYEYDKANRVIKVTDPARQQAGGSHTTLTSYDGLGRIANTTDAKNVVTMYTYDNNGNVLTVTVGGERTLTNTYDLCGNLLTSKDGNNSTTTYTYNPMNKVRTMVLSGDSNIGSNTITYRYTILGQPAVQTDSMGKTVTMTYDNQGRVLSTSEGTSTGTQLITMSNRYDKAGNLRFVVDGNGKTTEYTYDNLNRKLTGKISVTDVNNSTKTMTTTYTYDANGNMLSETDWRGNAYTYIYDTMNRLIQKKDPANTIIEKLVYNDNSAQIYSIDALDNTTEFRYDRNGRIVMTIDGAGNTKSRSYDSVGNLATTTDGNGNVTVYSYDNRQNLTSVTNALGEITSYTCERGGYLESILPESVSLTAEQFKTFLDKTLLTDFARRTLERLTEQDGGKTAETRQQTELP